MMRNRALLLLVLLPAGAFANGAMGLAYEVWSLSYWGVYVAAMVLLEAWWMGKRLGFSAGKSLLFSVLANALTAFCCLVNPLSAAMHGSLFQADRNPLAFGFWALTLFAIPTALVEGVIWERAVKGRSKEILLHSFLVHLVGVPIALAILLIPERPYVGIEATATGARWRIQRYFVKRELEKYVGQNSKFPDAKTPAELLKALDLPYPDLVFYDASYRRFSTRDERDKPMTFNSTLAGKPLNESDTPDWQMIARSQTNPTRGLYINFANGEVFQGPDPTGKKKP